MQHRGSAIGIFDSGIGGLTVMQQVVHQLPRESITYFGDTARLPYGEKSRDTIIRYCLENATFLINEKNIKMLVVACNTASSHALDVLVENFQIPIVGVINPGARKAVDTTRNGRIAVLGTRGTIQSGAYQREIHRLMPKATVFSVACPLWVHLVEEQWTDHPAAKLIVKEYLAPLKKENIDTVLLGCTHYPLLEKLIQEEMGDVTIVDSASTCAQEVSAILQAHQLDARHASPTRQFYVSDDPEKFRRMGEAFLKEQIPAVEFISRLH